ncbi:hypothetical protein HDC92_003083 [Pedobacter sp. AK017]|uniref:RagB/SusD family nutrient uptake outer membrane protein n=1 Tax=Pedobacter sp. AK017 TaxID=2723073 RepID=UPI001617899A|nr:RagB/SusD family nutrient uptake outer membrane protein [Pedobacter sp. AK017]MBB5439390.1 hypothetical protein [Pedobacter sp. AK017]
MNSIDKNGIKATIKKQIEIGLIVLLVIHSGCNKLVEIDPPVDTITTEQVFADDNNAIAAVTGIYSKLAGKNEPFSTANGGTSIVTGLSSDELAIFSSAQSLMVIYRNELVERGPHVQIDGLWRRTYEYIFPINVCLENLNKSPGITATTRLKLLAEVKFLRTFCYFNLINLYGDVPFVETTDWDKSRLTKKMSKAEIYQILINDLLEIKGVLPEDYTSYNNERVRATRWAAEALLARLYLYNENWVQAEISATNVISNTLYSLPPNLSDVFLKNSKEAILQWHNSSSVGSVTQNITPEGYVFIPQFNNRPPDYFLSNQLLSSFEVDDKRKIDWIKTITYLNKQYSFSFKYKKGFPDMVPNGPVTEYSMVLRLAEQYLIRAEARVNQDNINGAKADLDVIRKRAGLGVTTATSKEQLLAAIEQERRVELFTESGHRWFDLKRTGRIDAVMSVVTPQKSNGATIWKSYQQVYPIPYGEITLNPNLTQNSGY